VNELFSGLAEVTQESGQQLKSGRAVAGLHLLGGMEQRLEGLRQFLLALAGGDHHDLAAVGRIPAPLDGALPLQPVEQRGDRRRWKPRCGSSWTSDRGRSSTGPMALCAG